MTAEIFVRINVIEKTKLKMKQQFIFSSILISMISKIGNTNYLFRQAPLMTLSPGLRVDHLMILIGS